MHAHVGERAPGPCPPGGPSTLTPSSFEGRLAGAAPRLGESHIPTTRVHPLRMQLATPPAFEYVCLFFIGLVSLPLVSGLCAYMLHCRSMHAISYFKKSRVEPQKSPTMHPSDHGFMEIKANTSCTFVAT
jgi:hypothetical protein